MKKKVEAERTRVPTTTKTMQRPWKKTRPGKIRPMMWQKGMNWHIMPPQNRMAPPMVR